VGGLVPGWILGFGGGVCGFCAEGASHLTDGGIFASGRILAIGLTLLSQVRRISSPLGTRAIASDWVGLSLGGFRVSAGASVGFVQRVRRTSLTGESSSTGEA